MQKYKCSVLVPAYNEESNIANCITSLLNQSYKNIEILIIDDGSTDKTAKIANQFAQAHSNIKYLYQENAGASDARRNGLENCSSEFVAFVDADDLLSPDAISFAMLKFTQDVDIVLFLLAIEQDKPSATYKYLELFTSKKTFTGMKALKNCLRNWSVHGLGIFRKHILVKSYQLYDIFNPKKENWINNDEIITRFNFFHAKNVSVSDGTYFYKYNASSTTKRINPNYYKILHNQNLLLEFCEQYKVSTNSEILILYHCLIGIKNKLKSYGKNIDNRSEWKKTMRIYLRKILSSKNSQITITMKFKCLKYYLKFLF